MHELIKWVERVLRRCLLKVIGWVFSVSKRVVALHACPHILVVRVDARVGNLVLLTPLLSSLRARFAAAQIDLLASPKASTLLHGHPDIQEISRFRKWALGSPDGPLLGLLRLRRRHYDLAIDASNPTNPSLTHAFLVRFSGARFTVGFGHPDLWRLYTTPVMPVPPNSHEIDLRLRLLEGLPGNAVVRQVSLGFIAMPKSTSKALAFLQTLNKTRFALINVGGRVREKRLDPSAYAAIVALVHKGHMQPVVVYGPNEQMLAAQVVREGQGSLLAPPTDLSELALVMSKARLLVTCDSGPMHLSVALGTPTCGIFVATDPIRYGYTRRPHAAIDARTDPSETWLANVAQWISANAPST